MAHTLKRVVSLRRAARLGCLPVVVVMVVVARSRPGPAVVVAASRGAGPVGMAAAGPVGMAAAGPVVMAAWEVKAVHPRSPSAFLRTPMVLPPPQGRPASTRILAMVTRCVTGLAIALPAHLRRLTMGIPARSTLAIS